RRIVPDYAPADTDPSKSLRKVVNLLHEELTEPLLQALLDLPDTLAADAPAFAELLERKRLLGHESLAKDLELAPLEACPERLELPAHELIELPIRDCFLGGLGVGLSHQLDGRRLALWVRRGVDGQLGGTHAHVHLDDFFLLDTK